MRIVVTGGAGFIGTHLCKKLLDKGDEVICIDNLFTGSLDNVNMLAKNYPNSFKFIKYDIAEPLVGTSEYLTKVDQIYNLACPASPPHYQYDPLHTLDTNYFGMRNVLELARVNGARVLQASTSECYGDPDVHPQVESYRGNVNTYGIRACYDEGKRVAETLCFEYRHTYNVDTKIVRIFNTYGPYMRADDGRVVSNFICQALKGEDITIYGTGDQTRSFQYVSDLVNGIIKMMASESSGPINLGNPGEFTVKELAEIIVKLTNSKSKIVYKDLPLDDPTRRKPDITKAKNELNWAPEVELITGLSPTIEYFKGVI